MSKGTVIFLLFGLCIFQLQIANAQCSDSIPIPNVEGRVVLDTLPSDAEIDSTSMLSSVFVFHTFKEYQGYKLCSRVDSNWVIWEIDEEHTYNPYNFNIEVMKVDHIEDSVIYLEWSDYDVGSGSGSITHSKSFWSRDGTKCYARFVDKCSYIFKDRYGDGATGQVFETKFYCKATFSKFGIRVTANNVCGYNFDIAGNGKQAAILEVSKIPVGFYSFREEAWLMRK